MHVITIWVNEGYASAEIFFLLISEVSRLQRFAFGVVRIGFYWLLSHSESIQTVDRV